MIVLSALAAITVAALLAEWRLYRRSQAHLAEARAILKEAQRLGHTAAANGGGK